MTREEMLTKMNLTSDEHTDLMAKYEAFAHSLNENQQKVLTSTLITLEQARKTFGPGTTADDVAKLVGPCFAFANASCNGAVSLPLPPHPPVGKEPLPSPPPIVKK